MDSNKKKSIKTKTLFEHKSENKLIKKMTRKEKKIFVKYYDDKIKSINTFNLLNYIKKKIKKQNHFF